MSAGSMTPIRITSYNVCYTKLLRVSDGEFSFLDFARDYYGHDPAALEATAVLLARQAAPVFV